MLRPRVLQHIGALAGILVLAACGESTAPASFSAQYDLAAVQPTPGVPTSGNGGKNVIRGCMEAQAGRTLIQSVVYSTVATSSLTQETTTWTYHVDAGEIIVNDPNNVLMGNTTIGTTADGSISTYRVLQNDGMPITRTLVFDKVGGLGSTCGSVQWRGF